MTKHINPLIYIAVKRIPDKLSSISSMSVGKLLASFGQRETKMLRILMIVTGVIAAGPANAAVGDDSCAAWQSEGDAQKTINLAWMAGFLSAAKDLGSYRPSGNTLPTMDTLQQLVATGCKVAPDSRIRDIAVALAFYSPASGECINPPLAPNQVRRSGQIPPQ